MLPIVSSIAVGPVTVTPHGLFFAFGAMTAAAYIFSQRHALNLSAGTILERVFWIFAVGLLGARFTYLLAYPDEWTSVLQLVQIWEGGLVSFGGIVAGTALVFWYHGRAPRGEAWLSVAGGAFLLGWAVGRLGNFFALESAGVASPTWNFLYGTVPIQLFEAVGCIVLFFLVRNLPGVQIRYVTLFGYFVLRFMVDFWRDETVSAGLRTSQWVSLLFIVGIGGVYLSMLSYHRRRSHGA